MLWSVALDYCCVLIRADQSPATSHWLLLSRHACQQLMHRASQGPVALWFPGHMQLLRLAVCALKLSPSCSSQTFTVQVWQWGPQQESAQPHHGQIARDKMSTKVCKQLQAAHECLAHADTAFSGRDAAQLLDLLQVRLVAWSLHTEHTCAFILMAMNKSQLWTLHQCHMRPETPLAAPAYCSLAQ